MKKFTFYRNLGIATITSIGLVAIAASCGTTSSTDEQKNKVETESNKVTVEYTNKANVLLKDTKDSDLVFSGFDKTKYEVEEITSAKTTNGINVSFVLKDKTSKTKSAKKTKTITGFKPTDEQKNKVEAEANKVTVEYTNKANVFIKDTVDSGLVFSGFDNTKYEVEEITTVKTVNDVTVSFVLKEKASGTKSAKKTKTITGFKVRTTEQIKMELQNERVKVTLTYPNHSTTNINDADNNKFVFSDFDNKTFTPEIIKAVPDKNAKNISVTFVLVDNLSKQRSEERTLRVIGFLVTNLSDNEEIARVLNLVQVTYSGAQDVLVQDALQASLVFSGYNTGLYDVNVKKFEPSVDREHVAVTITITNKVTKLVSQEKQLIVTGFKKRA